MFNTTAYKITKFLIKNDIIIKEDEEIYTYGVETIIAASINTLIILLIGMSFGYLMETIVFMICYCPLRQHAGGYHASNYFRCLLSFIGIYLSTLFIFTVAGSAIKEVHIAVILLASCIGIVLMAPVEDKNKSLEETEKAKYRRIAIKLVATESVAIILLFSVDVTLFRYFIFATLAIAWVTVLALLGLIKNLLQEKKGGNSNEQNG